jgi:hypothetical protein
MTPLPAKFYLVTTDFGDAAYGCQTLEIELPTTVQQVLVALDDLIFRFPTADFRVAEIAGGKITDITPMIDDVLRGPDSFPIDPAERVETAVRIAREWA